MIKEPFHLLMRILSANARCWKHSWRTLVLQTLMVVGLLSLTAIVMKTIPATVHAETPDAIVATLEHARHDLAINTALETRVAAELETLRQTGQTPCDVITDYEVYLERVRAMLAENQRLVKQLESLQLQRSITTSSRQASEAETLQAIIDAPIAEEEVTDEVDALDRELSASLAEFDDMLLEELQLIREQSSPKIDALAQAAAEAAERLRERGIDIDASHSETQSGSEESRQQTASGAASETPPTETASGKPATPEDRAGEGVEGDRKKQTGRYDGSDDDIVARQLREAAEQETDPVLKKKLWQEYEAYKRSGT